MPMGLDGARRTIALIRDALGDAGAVARLAPRATDAPRIRTSTKATPAALERTWRTLAAATGVSPATREALADPATLAVLPTYAANIEAIAGTVKVPVGVIGPLAVNGIAAAGPYYVPLATTEAALVASYARGAEIVTAAGGVTAAVTTRAVMRAPAFDFATMMDAGRFVAWVCDHEPRLAAAAEATTRHGRLIQIEPHMLGETVYLICRYETGDAAGQNMVTIATDALCRVIEEACPVRPRHWFLEANFSGDKKASYLAVLTGRGRKVSVSATIPAALVRRRLHTDIPTVLAYARLANLGALASGTVGAHGHIANGLAALYLATGQDVACVAESAVGFLRMDAVVAGAWSGRAEEAAAQKDSSARVDTDSPPSAATPAAASGPAGTTTAAPVAGRSALAAGSAEPALHVTLTLPNVVVGTVGGGTGLPSQAAALDILGLRGDGKADALAEVAAALCLAGEVSIIGALAAGDFAHAHASLARARRPGTGAGPDGSLTT